MEPTVRFNPSRIRCQGGDMKRTSLVLAFLVTIAVASASSQDRDRDLNRTPIRHVLLISVDGMHAVDFLNCSQGLPTINGGNPYCPNIAALSTTGVNYTSASTSRPSDSFPGLMSIVTGATPRTLASITTSPTTARSMHQPRLPAMAWAMAPARQVGLQPGPQRNMKKASISTRQS